MNVISSYLCFCWCDRNQTLVWCPVGHPFEASNCCFTVNTCKNHTNLSGQALLERSMITRWSLGDHCKEDVSDLVSVGVKLSPAAIHFIVVPPLNMFCQSLLFHLIPSHILFTFQLLVNVFEFLANQFWNSLYCCPQSPNMYVFQSRIYVQLHMESISFRL